MSFKKGDKVVCLNNYHQSGVGKLTITIGKDYEIIRMYDDICVIRNDIGLQGYYNANNFINICDHRDNIIDNILDL